ncbi:MAG: Arylsulfotransferase [Mucilaginibacter sp.]|nr:Arylsulfotransferase [Mucilaginibacter sp.]
MNKKISLWLILLLFWFSSIVTLLFGWAVWYIKSDGPLFKGKTASYIISIASFPSLVKESFTELFTSSPLIRPNLYPSINGFKMEKGYVDSNYVLVSTYDKRFGQSIVKLVRLYDQTTIHQWVPDFDMIKKAMQYKSKFWHDANKLSILLRHPLLANDGSIIFNNGRLSPLIKINEDSKLIWVANGAFHHSLEYDADGNIWSPSVIAHSRFLSNLLNDYRDGAIAEISPNGKLLFEKSIGEILLENGYRTLLLGTGIYEHDLLHVNDIQPALTSTKYWMKGDLLISIRYKSTVLLYRPSINKIVWLKTGPWINQHDVDFIDSTRIGIFGNNTIRLNENNERLIDGYNEEYVYNFKTNKTETPYTEFLKKAKVSTLGEGRSDILPNGDLFIEETDKNRLLRGNTKNTIWQFVNCIDQHSVNALSWCRFISKEDFKKLKF